MSALRLRQCIAPRVSLMRSSGLQRTFQTSGALRVSKESELHNERSGEHLEAEKQKHLKDQKEGKGEWKASLSSDSEESVKADRGEIKGSSENIKTLQEESAKKSEQDRKAQ